MSWTPENYLSVSYTIPDSGRYEHDLLADELAGPEARTSDFGTYMFRIRTLGYGYPTLEARGAAVKRFSAHPVFKIYQP